MREDNDFSFINSHEKTGAVRDTSQKETLKRSLRERLNNSKNMILIVGETTKLDTDWVPFELEYAIDDCKIPIIAAYPRYESILSPSQLSYLWPKALSERIQKGTAHVIHIPFKKDPLKSAVSQFDFDHYPLGGGLGYYSRETYMGWGLING